MNTLWRIKPLEKKSIEYFIDVYEIRDDGTTRGWSATFYYRWGQGFRDHDNPPNNWEAQQNSISVDPQVGWGCELDDLCGVDIDFDDNFTEQEQATIRALCVGDEQDEEGRWGESWIFDGEHNWQIEEDVINIYQPFQIDLVDKDQYNVVIEELVTLED